MKCWMCHEEKFKPINLCPKCIRIIVGIYGMDTGLRVDYDYYGEEDGEQ